MTTKITVCIVMGLPAVGKTTLTKQLALHLRQNDVHCCVFSYDQLMPERIDLECELQEKKFDGVATHSKWKMHRKMVFDLIEASVMYFRKNEYSNVLDTYSQNQGCDCFQSKKSSVECTWHVVLVDDNMFYRSMRYCFYQLSRVYECSFCQIYLKNNFEELMRRNTNREGIVTDKTIRKMASVYEVPDKEKFYWEKHSIVLNNPDLNDKNVIKILDAFISDISLEIVPPLESEQDRVERDRCKKEVLQNYLHQCDQILRKFISMKMGELKSSINNEKQLKEKGAYLNNQRKGYLQFLKIEKRNVVDILSSEDWKRNELIRFQSFLEQHQ